MNNQEEPLWSENLFDSRLSTRAQRQVNDEFGLIALAKFGWLTAGGIGNVLWPLNATRHVAGSRIARRWVEQGLALERTLPVGLGKAYVLSQRGADYVNAETYYGEDFLVKSGKKIGDHVRNSDDWWVPTYSWQHDLLSNGFLALAMGSGRHVVSELELRREGGQSRKIPDGLYSVEGNEDDFIAIEVERTGKWSSDLRRVSRSIVDSGLYGSNVCGRCVVATVLVYASQEKHFWGAGMHPVHDHLGRVARSCEAYVPEGVQIKVVGIPLVTSGASVIDILRPVYRFVGNVSLDSL